ncbi:MAG: hypothetical protein ABI376_07730 [Caulobacteraceae bacterium]
MGGRTTNIGEAENRGWIAGNTVHTARLPGQGRWFLGGSTEWPGVVPADVEIGDVEATAARYPAVAPEIRAIAASARTVAARRVTRSP